MKRLLTVLLAVLMVLSFVGCNKKPEPEENKLSGTVTVYTSHTDADQELFSDMFKELYPDVTIEWVYNSVGASITKLEAEKDNPQCDVLIGGLMQSDGDIYHHLFQPYTPSNIDQLSIVDPTHYYQYYNTQVMTFLVNTKVLANLGLTLDDVQGYEDLLNPKLKGHIMHADPSAASSAWRQVTTMIALFGNSDLSPTSKGWDFIAKLMDNLDGVTTAKSGDVTRMVDNGEMAVGLSYESTCVQRLVNKVPDIAVVYPKEGNTEVGFAGAMIKNCKHPEIAAKVLDFLCSKEYNDARMDLLGASRTTNKTSKKAPLCPDTSTLGLVPLPFEYMAEHRDDILKQYADLWTEHSK